MEKEKIREFAPIISRERNDGKEYYRALFREFPDMIGGIGDTVSEAIEEAYCMLETEISFLEEEGMNVPSPAVVDLEAAPSGRITLRMSKTMHKMVLVVAEEEGVSINSLLNEAVSLYLGQKYGGVKGIELIWKRTNALISSKTISHEDSKFEWAPPSVGGRQMA